MGDEFLKFYCANTSKMLLCTSHFEGKTTLPGENCALQRIQCHGVSNQKFVQQISLNYN